MYRHILIMLFLALLWEREQSRGDNEIQFIIIMRGGEVWGWWGGSKTASCPSASFTSAQSTACFLLTLVTANCRVPLSIHLSIPPLTLNENSLVSLIL